MKGRTDTQQLSESVDAAALGRAVMSTFYESSDDVSSTTKVRIQRFPCAMGPVVGPAVIIDGIDVVAKALVVSGFMRPWLIQKIKRHLLSGGEFLNKGQSMSDEEEAIVPNGEVLSMRVRSEYRMATEGEVLDYVDHSQYAGIVGHKLSARAQEKQFTLHYHEGAEVIAAYDRLPTQAQVILDVLNETSREVFTEASIEVLLVKAVEEGRLKTRQEPLKIWNFYRHRLVDEGHVEESGG